ncbi:MAG TPA: hypothetical protein VMW42_00240 [Desulfatiglandales bacterium]|nr:hypothetical protein [Desulfatiglandales bacterium]
MEFLIRLLIFPFSFIVALMVKDKDPGKPMSYWRALLYTWKGWF